MIIKIKVIDSQNLKKSMKMKILKITKNSDKNINILLKKLFEKSYVTFDIFDTNLD